MLKKILIGLAILILVFVAVVSTRPSDFKVTRTAVLPAPPAKVFALVNDFHSWPSWSPWEKMDPDMKRTYGGAASGLGATYAWVGNDQVGEGNMTITESRPNELILIRLEFVKPMAGVNPTELSFKPEGKGTQVTWTMTGKHNFIGKAFCMFMDMDKMVGGDFERGLENLGQAAAASGKK